MKQPTYMFFTVELADDDLAVLRESAQIWLQTVMPLLDSHAFRVALDQSELISFRNPRRPLSAEDRWGEPGGAWIKASLSMTNHETISDTFPGSIESVVASLCRLEVGETLSLSFWAMDAEGRPIQLSHDGGLDFGLSAASTSEGGFVLRLSAGTSYWQRLMGAVNAIRDFVDARQVMRGTAGIQPDVFAEQWVATYGGDEARLQSRSDLVSAYNWITVVSPWLTAILEPERLKLGTQELETCQVLTSGALWIQATADPRYYGVREAERIVDVIGPVLPEGRPKAHWIPTAYAPLASDGSS